jgi:hypothetical protein
MKTYARVVCAFLLTSQAAAMAAGKHRIEVPEPSPPPQHWDVKGAVLGSKFEDLQHQVQGDLDCHNVTSGLDFEFGIDQRCTVKGEQKCTLIGSKNFCHDTTKYDTFAGQSIHILYGLHEGSLWQIELIGISPPAFDSVVATMESKYGKATIAKSDIQNRMGAHFEQGVAYWQALDHIAYIKYRERLDAPSDLTFFSADAWEQRERINKSVTESAKSDM